MNISASLMLTIGLTAFSLFVIILVASFLTVMRNRRNYRQAVNIKHYEYAIKEQHSLNT